MDVIDLQAERERRDGPDPEHVVTEGGGKWYKFALSYKDDDKQYGLHIWATDFADAERRVRLMRDGLKLDGQVYVSGGF
jgi:hypothetical protein